MEETLKLPSGTVPDLPPKALSLEAIEAWQAEIRRGLQARGLLDAILADPTRTPRGPRFRLPD